MVRQYSARGTSLGQTLVSVYRHASNGRAMTVVGDAADVIVALQLFPVFDFDRCAAPLFEDFVSSSSSSLQSSSNSMYFLGEPSSLLLPAVRSSPLSNRKLHGDGGSGGVVDPRMYCNTGDDAVGADVVLPDEAIGQRRPPDGEAMPSRRKSAMSASRETATVATATMAAKAVVKVTARAAMTYDRMTSSSKAVVERS